MLAKIILEKEGLNESRFLSFSNHPWEVCDKLSRLNRETMEDVFLQNSTILDLFVTEKKLARLIQNRPDFFNNKNRWVFKGKHSYVLLLKTDVSKSSELGTDFDYFLGKDGRWSFKAANKMEWFPMLEFTQLRRFQWKVEGSLNSIKNLEKNNPGSELIKKHEEKIKRYSVKTIKIFRNLNENLRDEYFTLIVDEPKVFSLINEVFEDFLKEKNYEKLSGRFKKKNNILNKSKI